MKRIATAMVLALALMAVGKFSPLGAHWRQIVADEEGDGGGGDEDDGGGDESGT